MRTVILSAVCSLLLAPLNAAAQLVYKSTLPDGSVVYAEKPAPGAQRVEKIEPPPAQAGISSLTPEEKARADQLARQRAADVAAAAQNERSVEAARKQLQQAEAARDTGKEPLAGERAGIAGGGSRLTDAYFARQKSLEDAVNAARKRVAEAQPGAR